MRTTISIDEGLLAGAKRRARERGISLSQFVQEAVKAQLAQYESREPAPPFELITFAGGPRPGIDLDRTSALLDDDDIASFGNRERSDAAS